MVFRRGRGLRARFRILITLHPCCQGKAQKRSKLIWQMSGGRWAGGGGAALWPAGPCTYALINININGYHSLSRCARCKTDVRDIQATCIRASLYYLSLPVMDDSIFQGKYKFISRARSSARAAKE